MKIGVVGCGALGSFYGARLWRAGEEVHLLLRSDYEVVRRAGVGLKGLDPRVLSRTVDVPFSGKKIRFVSREDFIAMKGFAGGPQGLEDGRVAIRTAGETLDLDLLRKVTRRFGRNAADALEQALVA